MAFLLGRLVRNAARRIATDPQAREMATKAGRDAWDEAKVIRADSDPARAAGRSMRRVLNRIQRASADADSKDVSPDTKPDNRPKDPD